MIKILVMLSFLFYFAVPVSAMEVKAPAVPQTGAEIMPEDTASFSDALLELAGRAMKTIEPNIAEAVNVSVSVICAVLLMSSFQTVPGTSKKVSVLAGCAAISALLMNNTNAMICLGTQTIRQMSDYGKLLYPVMTAAMAAQGGVTSSAALYTGTAIFDALLGSLIANIFTPMVYIYLAFSVANSAAGEDILKRFADMVKNLVSWCLKTILMIYTSYMSITGVVSGTTDAAALKAAKITISSVVPVVGGILSDSSEAILIGVGTMKNAAGVYGILACLAVFLGPFLRIGCHYFALKVSAAICSIFGTKEMVGLMDNFSTAMGLILAMTSAVCLLLLISTICFMKGIS